MNAARLLLLCLLALIAIAQAAAETLVIDADTLYTASDAGMLTDARVIIENGRIEQVGSQDQVQLPDDARQLTAATVTPGLIDARTTVGLSGAFNVAADQDQDETTDPNTAQLRALDGFNPAEAMLDFVRGYGVTTIQTGPGDLNLIAGQTTVVKTAGRRVESMALKPTGAMIFNLGERPKAIYGERDKAPSTRMASAALIRAALNQARNGSPQGDDEGPTEAAVNLSIEALVPVVQGEMPAIFIAHREDDIATALRITEEFGLDAQIAYATEGYLMRDQLKAAAVPILIGPALQRLDGLQTFNASLENAALLADADIPFAFSTGHEAYVPKTRVLLFEMAIAVANGLDPQTAIRAATINAARFLGIENRVGSIEAGKDADLVLFDGDPFEYTSHVTGVVMDGLLLEDQPR